MRRIYITPNQFTIENGTLTPTLKVKRLQAKHMYLDVIKEMYEKSLTKGEKEAVSNNRDD